MSETRAFTAEGFYKGRCLTGIQEITEQWEKEDFKYFKQDFESLIKQEMRKMVIKRTPLSDEHLKGCFKIRGGTYCDCKAEKMWIEFYKPAEILENIDNYKIGG